ncbi:MAG: hypothetical protein J5845_08295 [Lachnospiraceae bacterium]|nr:hypothetical protein [Lachnospiraceae bacterium]
MILDIVKLKDEPAVGECAIKRNGRVVGGIKMVKLPNPTGWEITFGGKVIRVTENSSRATTEMISASQLDTDGNYSGLCYQIHSGSLFNKYDIYEMRYQSLSYTLYPIAPSDCKALPVFYGALQIASVENDLSDESLFRDGQVLAEDDRAAFVGLIFLCYVRSYPGPLVSVTNKKLLGKIDRSFPDRIRI